MKTWDKQVEMADKEFKLKSDKELGYIEYLKLKDEMAAKAEIEGNKKLLQKYNYDELPWIRKLFTPRQHVD
jgi:DNA polymerase I-like protein with 3'-5' exonuclease and polymerase domains